MKTHNRKMKISTLILFFLLVITTSFAQKSANDREPGELLVMMMDDQDPLQNAMLRANLEANGIIIDHKITKSFNIWLFRFNEKNHASEKVLKIIRQHPAVKIAQFNHKVTERQLIPNDQSFNLLWALLNTGQSGGTPGADIHATEAWDITNNGITALGDTIVIAVIDGGVELSHPDLNLKKNWNEIPLNLVDDDNNGYIDDFNGWNAYASTGNMVTHDHGTHVIGIAAAKTNNGIGISGVSFNAKVLPIAGSGTNDVLVASAYDYVYTMRKAYNESNGASGAYIVASNSSFGVDGGDPINFPLWGAMYDSMGMVGILNVASTANKSYDVDIEGDIPTSMTNESIIAVTNTTNMDLRNTQAAWGLNSIDIGAPGTNIYSTRQGNTYGYKTGTSMSSPMVSGSIALLYAATDSLRLLEYKESPNLAVNRFKRYLLATVDTIPSLVGITVSGGRLNLRDAVLMAANPPMLSTNTPILNVGLKPDSTDISSLHLFSSSTKPDPFTLNIIPEADWITLDTMSGLFTPGEPQYIRVYVDATGLPEGNYSTSIIVKDYFINELVIPVNLKVDRNIAVRKLSTNTNVSLSPNPFSELLKINMNLLRSSDLNVKVISLQGITLATIHNGILQSGNHTLVWDGKNSVNQNIRPGVYFIVVTDRSGSVTLKAVKK